MFRLRDVEGRTHRLGFFGYWCLTIIIVGLLYAALTAAFGQTDVLGDRARILSARWVIFS